MKFLTILLFLYSICALAIPSNPELEHNYFKLLDYQSLDKRPQIFELEAHLCMKADYIIRHFELNPGYKPEPHESSLEKIGMYLAYTGLFLMNNNNAAIDGVLTFEEITSNMKRSDKNEKREEIFARYELADKYFSLAERLAPEDDRIKGWHLSALFRFQKYKVGVVDQNIMDRMLLLVEAHPIFHLYNALTMNSNYAFSAEHEKILFKNNEFLSGSNSPCNTPKPLRSGEAKRCSTTNKTPYAVPGVMTYMGDVYLKEATRTTDEKQKQEYLNTALRLYKMPKVLKPFKVLSWDQRKNLNSRMQIAKEMIHGGQMPSNYYQSNTFQDMYSCKSCHQDGVVKDQLDISL